jgi:hypothetical protein
MVDVSPTMSKIPFKSSLLNALTHHRSATLKADCITDFFYWYLGHL